MTDFKDVADLLLEEKKKNPKAFVNYKVVEFKPEKQPGFFKRQSKQIVKAPQNFRNKIWKKVAGKKDIEFMVNN